MPEHCAAFSCTNRRTIANRARGITFHKFPKDQDMRKEWEVALRREGFTASRFSVICSEHFKQDDFDRTGQVVRLRDGVIPSIFSFSVHLQRPGKGRTTSTSRKAKESLPVAPLDDPEASTSHSQPQPGKGRTTSRSRKAKESLPVAPRDDPEASTSHSQPQPGKGRTTSTSRKAKESLPVAPRDDPEASTSRSQPQPNDDHSYALPASPAVIKARLSEALARVESLEREKKNAMAREKRAKTIVMSLLGDLREKNFINEELKERLYFYSDLQIDFMAKRGHEYSEDHKEFALTLYLHGPEAYKYLRETRGGCVQRMTILDKMMLDMQERRCQEDQANVWFCRPCKLKGKPQEQLKTV